jgi:hypothetical protein
MRRPFYQRFAHGPGHAGTQTSKKNSRIGWWVSANGSRRSHFAAIPITEMCHDQSCSTVPQAQPGIPRKKTEKKQSLRKVRVMGRGGERNTRVESWGCPSPLSGVLHPRGDSNPENVSSESVRHTRCASAIQRWLQITGKLRWHSDSASDWCEALKSNPQCKMNKVISILQQFRCGNQVGGLLTQFWYILKIYFYHDIDIN